MTRRSSFALIVLMAILLNGCGGGVTTPRSAQRPVVTEYKNWAIRVTPSSVGNQWRARIQIWPPEVRPENHGGINLSFVESASSESAIVQAALGAARRYIDASQPVHSR
jgi:hypothetical protein